MYLSSLFSDEFDFLLDSFLPERKTVLYLKWNKEKTECSIDLPGVGKENIELSTLNDQTLKISVKKPDQKFEKTIKVPYFSSIDPSYVDGVLKIKFDWKEKEEVKKIELK